MKIRDVLLGFVCYIILTAIEKAMNLPKMSMVLALVIVIIGFSIYKKLKLN